MSCLEKPLWDVPKEEAKSNIPRVRHLLRQHSSTIHAIESACDEGPHKRTERVVLCVNKTCANVLHLEGRHQISQRTVHSYPYCKTLDHGKRPVPSPSIGHIRWQQGAKHRNDSTYPTHTASLRRVDKERWRQSGPVGRARRWQESSLEASDTRTTAWHFLDRRVENNSSL